MGKKFRNLGFTLVEMIVAFAVLGVATLGIGGFFVTSARSSAGTSSQSQVQNEAQLAMNQMERLIIDTGLGLNYNVITAEGDHFVLNDAGFDSALVESKLLYIFNVDPEDASNIQLILLKWDKDQNIYYKEINLDEAGYGASNVEDLNVEAIGEWELLAEGVDSFSAILDGERKKVSLSANFVRSDDNYQASAVITVRNDIVVNELSLEKLFDRIDVVVKTRITGVKIAVSPKITASGSSAMLKSEILGKGDPEKNMDLAWQWLVATDSGMSNLIYDSINSGDWAASIADGNLSLDISKLGEEFNGVVYIQAIVTAKEKENPENVTVVKSGVAELKIIDQMSISFSKDGVDYSNSLGTDASAVEAYELETEETLQLYANIEGKALESSEKAVIWSIAEGATAEASVSSDGLLAVDRQSKPGTFAVRATLKANQSVWVEYPFEVVSEYVTDAALVVTPAKEVLLRGEEVAHTVKLGKQDVLAEDCDWTVTVKNVSANQVVTGSPVTVGSTGVVSVLDTLAYEYDYKVIVTAALKKDATIKGSAELSIPKVTFKVETPRNYIVPGGVIEGVKCTVTGLKNYMVNWTMAKSNASDYFFTAYGNSHITGYETGNHLANVVLGSDDTTIEYIFVKASLEGSKNFTDMVKIETPTMAIQGAASVVRGGSAAYKVAIAGMDSPTGVIWRIKNQPDGVEIGAADGVLKVRPDFNWSMKDYDTTVTVQAEWNGMKREFVVTIPKTKFVLNPTSTTMNPGDNSDGFVVEMENIVGDYEFKLVDQNGTLIPSDQAYVYEDYNYLLWRNEYKIEAEKNIVPETFSLVAYVVLDNTKYEGACTTAQVTVNQSFTVSAASSSVNRGGSVELTAYRNGVHEIPDSEMKWSISSAKYKEDKLFGSSGTIGVEGLSVDSNGVLKISPDFAWSYLSNKYKVTVTVQASWTKTSGTKTTDITINSATFTLNPANTDVIAGNSASFTLNHSGIEGISDKIGLKLVDMSGAVLSNDIATAVINGNTITATTNIDARKGTQFKARAYVNGYDAITADSTVTIGQSISAEATATIVNRGGSTVLTAKKNNGAVISNSAVAWSIDGNPSGVSITNGVLSVAPDYAWGARGSNQTLTVRASWMGGETTVAITVPPASFTLAPSAEQNIIAGNSLSLTLSYSGIEGINNHIVMKLVDGSGNDLSANVATANRSGNTITVDTNIDAQNNTLFKVKAYVEGYTSIVAETAVTIGQNITVQAASITVNRGGSTTLVAKKNNGVAIDNSAVRWSVDGNPSGVSISNGLLRVHPDYVWEYRGSNQTLTVRASWMGGEATVAITIPPAILTLDPEGDQSIYAGDSQTFTLHMSGMECSGADVVTELSPGAPATVTKNDEKIIVTVNGDASAVKFQLNTYISGYPMACVTKNISAIPGLEVISAMVERGGSVGLTAKNGNTTIPAEDITWQIIGENTAGLTINEGNSDTLTVAPDYEWSSKGGSVDIAVRGTWKNGVYDEGTITVKPTTFTVTSGSSTIGSDGCNLDSTTVTLNASGIQGNVLWKVSNANLASISGSGTTRTLESKDNYGTVTVTAYIEGYERACATTNISIVKLDVYAAQTSWGSTTYYRNGATIKSSTPRKLFGSIIGWNREYYDLYCMVNGSDVEVNWAKSNDSAKTTLDSGWSLSRGTYYRISTETGGKVTITAQYNGISKSFTLNVSQTY